MPLEEALRRIQPADAAVLARAREKWNTVDKPLDSLGLLEYAVSCFCAMAGSHKADPIVQISEQKL